MIISPSSGQTNLKHPFFYVIIFLKHFSQNVWPQVISKRGGLTSWYYYSQRGQFSSLSILVVEVFLNLKYLVIYYSFFKKLGKFLKVEIIILSIIYILENRLG